MGFPGQWRQAKVCTFTHSSRPSHSRGRWGLHFLEEPLEGAGPLLGVRPLGWGMKLFPSHQVFCHQEGTEEGQG